MSKPWEKQYQTHPLDDRVIVEKDPHDEGDGWLAVADLRVPINECEEVGALFTAAPDMARAIYANGVLRAEDGEWHLSGCDGVRSLVECMPMCPVSRAALKKAGVL